MRGRGRDGPNKLCLFSFPPFFSKSVCFVFLYFCSSQNSGNQMGGWVMLVYWLHKAGEAAGDRMRLDRRIPLLVSTFKYTSRTEWKCFTFSFLNLRLGLSQPYVWLDEDQWISGVGGLARTPILHWGGLASEIANLTLDLAKLPNWPHCISWIDPENELSHHILRQLLKVYPVVSGLFGRFPERVSARGPS